MDGLDELWADLLSADAQRIQRAWDGLAASERESVHAHLLRMRAEAGWHASQRESAAAALAFIAGLAGQLPNPTE